MPLVKKCVVNQCSFLVVRAILLCKDMLEQLTTRLEDIGNISHQQLIVLHVLEQPALSTFRIVCVVVVLERYK